MPPELPRPPRRPSQVDPNELAADDPFEETRPSRPFEPEPGSRAGRDPAAGRYALRPDTEERLVRALKTLESIPPLQTQTSAKVDNVNVELMKLQHQAQLDGQRRDLSMERFGERIAVVEKRLDDVEKGENKTKETELERARNAQSHWVRYAVTVVISLITGAVLLGLGRLLK